MTSEVGLGSEVPAAEFFGIAPLATRRVLELGSGARDLADAYALINPTAEYRIRSHLGGLDDADADFDLIVLRSLIPDRARRLATLGALSARLARGGYMLFPAPEQGGAEAPGLRPLGGRRVGAAGEAGTCVVYGAARAADPPVQRLLLHFRYMAPRFMDIRTTLPAQQLARDPQLTVSAQPGAEPFYPARFPDGAPKVLVTQRPGRIAEEDWLRTTAMLIRRGWISVVEYDDHPALTAAVHGEQATEEGVRHFSLYHGVQTSTDPLAGYFRRLNPNVALLPNAVFTLPPLPRRQGPPKVFYGAFSRGGFAAEVAASLVQTAARFPQVEFIVVGDKAVFEALPTQNKRQYGTLSYPDYLKAMSWCDVLLSPLAASEAMETKSDAKYLDASRNGVVTLASPTVYDRTIRDGETGLIARELADWDRLLVALLEDAPRRERIARAAWEHVRRERMFAHQAAARREWYRSLWDRREALNAELIERAPKLRDFLSA